MRLRNAFVLCLLSLSVSGALAQATHSVGVTFDPATASDTALLAAGTKGMAEGPLNQSLRKLSAGIGGEVTLVAGLRIDSQGLLTLDDGSKVFVSQADQLYVNARVDDVRLIFSLAIKQLPNGLLIPVHNPTAIQFYYSDGTCKRIDFSTHPPGVGLCYKEL